MPLQRPHWMSELWQHSLSLCLRVRLFSFPPSSVSNSLSLSPPFSLHVFHSLSVALYISFHVYHSPCSPSLHALYLCEAETKPIRKSKLKRKQKSGKGSTGNPTKLFCDPAVHAQGAPCSWARILSFTDTGAVFASRLLKGLSFKVTSHPVLPRTASYTHISHSMETLGKIFVELQSSMQKTENDFYVWKVILFLMVHLLSTANFSRI